MAAELPLLGFGLLDVLEQLPRDVLRASVWLHLNPHSPPISRLPSKDLGRAFRLSCHRAHQLANQLTRRLHLDGPPEHQQARGNFLAGQECLEHLSLTDASSDGQGEARLVETLQTGGAACRRLGDLVLHVRAACSSAAAVAVVRSCPQLQELAWTFDAWGPDALTPLKACTHLAKVSVRIDSHGQAPLDVVEAMAALPSLTTLVLEGSASCTEVEDLSALTRATLLRQLHLKGLLVVGGEVSVDGEPLGDALCTLTHLTELSLPKWGYSYDMQEIPYDYAAITAAVLARLRSLTQLSSLAVASGRWMEDSAAQPSPALGRLSALTRLCCPAIFWPLQPQPANGVVGDGGMLPCLQHLELLEEVGYSKLRMVLLTLGPMAELRHLKLDLALGAEGWDPEAPAEEAAELEALEAPLMCEAVHLLETAPLLRRIDAALSVTDPWLYDSEFSMSMLGRAAAFVVPLRDRLTTVRLWGLRAQLTRVLWPLLSLAPRLQHLSMLSCQPLEEDLLAVVGKRMPALRTLKADYGVPGGLVVALAAVRTEPLCIVVHPPLDAVQCCAFWRAAKPGLVLSEEVDTLSDED